jgi:type IV pilus assembly protein PilA
VICPSCGAPNPDGFSTCQSCGLGLTAGPSRQRKGLAIASLVLGILSLPTLGIVGVGALLSIVLGVVALVKAGREPETYGGKGIAISGIAASVVSIVVMPFFLGIVAAIAIPSLLRARVSANETAAIADVRTIQSAEEAYQNASGSYGSLECLVTPSGCIRGYAGPTFLASQAAERTRSGYHRIFHEGPTLPGAPGPSTWAVVAVPVTRNRTGTRAFCADSTGRVCATLEGTPSVAGGTCSDPCQDLR